VRAMVTPQFGGTDLFEERDVEKPRPGAAEVLVRVVAAGTNPVDAKLRANGASAGLEAPIILGADISGVVEEVGPGVTDLALVTRFTIRLRSSVRARTVATPSTTSRRPRSWRRSPPRSHTRKQRLCRSPEERPTRR
jgi:NADPH:quinone reductase-like Zn-dependent oxidoreductase